MLLDDYEEFSETQLKILERYVTNTHSHVFVLRNLPEVIKGALFSRYSRSTLGLRSLLLKEFISNNEESSFAAITGGSGEPSELQNDQAVAIRKAQNFYDRILDGYGDDSIGELGGAHLAIENISMLAAKLVEDSRIGGSPLEKSTRYVYFDQKVKGEYLFYREPILMTSAYRDLYVNTCNMLFETYSKLISPLTEMIEEKMPKDQATSKSAYAAAVRAKVLDCLRGLLPAGTLTNMGIFGNGRFYEQLIHKMHCNNLAELQDLGKRAYDELSKAVPSFIRRSDLSHHTHQSFARYYEAMQAELAVVTTQNTNFLKGRWNKALSSYLLIQMQLSKWLQLYYLLIQIKGIKDLLQYCHNLPEEEIARILDAGCSARENRRHKSPRALENASFTFEMITDFGVYRDLHRHRLLTQERQFLSCDYGFYIPQEIVGTGFEEPYLQALHAAKEVYDTISTELPEEAQYVVPMAYNIRWYFHVNLRALQWLCELRSSAAGHSGYRFVAQEMAKQVSRAFPQFERFFKFVDFEGYDLGRLDQEVRKEAKQSHQ